MAVHRIDADRLRSIHLFKEVSDQHLPRLLKSASLRHVPARAILFREGERPTIFYTLIDGSVELFSEHHERRCTISVIHSSKPCLLTSIVNYRNPMSARTLERSHLLLVPAKVIHELIETDLGFACAATHELAGDCDEVIEDFKNHRLRKTIERLAHWMLRSEAKSGGTGRFSIPYDKRTLASYLGMAPENLSRNLAALASTGVVVRGRRVTLKDRAALAAAAGSAGLDMMAPTQ
jgi:CRP/FNR family transcriptional regulator, transcriptional activator FtrB